MSAYICENCGYRLESGKSEKNCPYCDSDSLAKEKSANELLNDIEAE